MLVKFTLELNVVETLDLTDYGYSKDIKWADLSDDEKDTILDRLRNDHIVNITVEDNDE